MSPNFVDFKMTDYQKTEWISLCLVLQEIIPYFEERKVLLKNTIRLTC